MIYLDNAATTKPSAEAVDAACKAAKSCFGNASSLHGMGIASEKLIKSAKQTVMRKLGVYDGEVFFTSGATESNNTALCGVMQAYRRRGDKIVTTAIEHPSVARVADKLEAQGINVTRLSPKDAYDDFEGLIADAVDKNTVLVSAMAVNNENGYKTDTERLYALVKRKNPDTIVHVDAVQGFCKVPIKADMISISGHKIHSLKGIGVLYAAKGVRFSALLLGGGQQKNLRSGTEPVELIASLEAAIKNYPSEPAHFEKLNSYLRSGLSGLSGIHINSDEKHCVPNILSFAVEGVRSEIMLHFLEEKGIYVSSGSACSKGKISSVPDAFGINDKIADSTLRVSFSAENSESDIDSLISAIETGIKRFRR